MSSKEVKDTVRDAVERGFDHVHRAADVLTYPLAPLDGAVHGAARGILNWLTDTHPEDKTNKKKCGCPSNKVPEPQQHNCDYHGGRGGGGGSGGYPAGMDPNRKVFNIKGNEISDNKADARAFNEFGNNSRANGSNNDNAAFDFQDNKMKGNGGKVEAFNDFGNYK